MVVICLKISHKCQKLPMLVVFCHFLTCYTPLKLFPQDFHKIFPQEFPARFSCKDFLQEFPARFSCKIFPQEFPTRFSHKNFPQDFPARISHKNFLQDFPTRISRKIFLQGFPARISHKDFLQDFPKLDPDWLAPHHPIPNAKFPPINALLNRPTYHKSARVSPPPFPQISWEPQINE